MISFKRFSGRRPENSTDGKSETSPPQKPAKEIWGVSVEPMTVNGEAVFALTFHRKGTSIYYLHRHYRDRVEAEGAFLRLSHDLGLGLTEFEMKYSLDAVG